MSSKRSSVVSLSSIQWRSNTPLPLRSIKQSSFHFLYILYQKFYKKSNKKRGSYCFLFLFTCGRCLIFRHFYIEKLAPGADINAHLFIFSKPAARVIARIIISFEEVHDDLVGILLCGSCANLAPDFAGVLEVDSIHIFWLLSQFGYIYYSRFFKKFQIII